MCSMMGAMVSRCFSFRYVMTSEAPSREKDSAIPQARLHLFAMPAMTAVFPLSKSDMNLSGYFTALLNQSVHPEPVRKQL